MSKEIGICENCRFFIPHITEINEYGFEICGYGCELGGNHLSKKTFFEGCKDFKIRISDKTCSMI